MGFNLLYNAHSSYPNTIHLADNKNFVMPTWACIQWLHPYQLIHSTQFDILYVNLLQLLGRRISSNRKGKLYVFLLSPCTAIPPKLYIVHTQQLMGWSSANSFKIHNKVRRCGVAWLMSVDLRIEYHIFVMQGTPFNIPLTLQLFYPSKKCFIKKDV